MKIRFLQHYVVKDEHRGTPQQTAYSEGQEVELSDRSAAHFLSRDLAEEVVAPPPPAVDPDLAKPKKQAAKMGHEEKE